MEYYRLLRSIHEHLRPRTYVEIGVRAGQSLTLAMPGTRVVGIDPQMELLFPVGPGARLFPLTSDDFFATHDLGAVLDGLPVDLAFIDGMHLFEYALRDFANLERHCGPSSVVLVHDCLPIDGVTSARERTTDVWSGDVWKLIVCLKRHRPDLTVTTLDVPPTGLGVITGLDPRSTVLSSGLDALYDELVPLGHDDVLAVGKDAQLNRVGHSWTEIAAALGAAVPAG